MAALKSYVVDETDVAPVRAEGDTASVRVTFDETMGCERLEQRVIEFSEGRSADRQADDRQEVLYVAAGAGTLYLDGEAHALAPNTGVFIAAGETYAVHNPGPDALRIVSVTAPDDGVHERAQRRVTVRFEEQPELEASVERSFRYLVNEDAGCFDITQFLGIVQPSKAPFHSHSYDEVGYIIEGEGVAHVGGRSIALRAGSCFHLPPNEVHCIENSGSGPMQILGVFHPAGSPANRAYPDNN
jgi:mannose-6-phosphate isomerase-like protein (cupin superfamily)